MRTRAPILPLLGLLLLAAGCASTASAPPPAARSPSRLADAQLLYKSGQYVEAERILDDELAREEREAGGSQLGVAQALRNLGILYLAEGRTAETDQVFRRVLAIREAELGPRDAAVAGSLGDLGSLQVSLGRFDEAEALYERALAIQVDALPANDPRIAITLDQLGVLREQRGRLDEADRLYGRALAIQKVSLGPDSPDLAVTLNNLGVLRKRQERPAETLDLYRQALGIHERALPQDHPKVAASLANLAVLQADEGRTGEALASIRRAAAIQEGRIARDMQLAAPGAPAERLTRLLVFPQLLRVGWRAYGDTADPGERDRLADETFRAAQVVQASDTASTLQRVAARFGAGSDDLARLVREQQDAAQRYRTLEQALILSLSRPASERDEAAERATRGELARLGGAIEGLDREMAARFPDYVELVSPRPLGLAEAQALLRPGEAMASYVDLGPGEQGFLWFVRRDGARLYRLPRTGSELETVVRGLRDQLDPGRGGGRTFDVHAARQLHRDLLPMDPALMEGITRLLVVPDGPLESLPFALLVASDPGEAATRDLRRVDWLVRHLATTTLPAASTLRTLRQVAKPSRAAEPFLGVGNPLLQGAGSATRTASRGVEAASLVSRRGLGDPRAIRALTPLPETAGELRALASSLGAGEGSLLLAGAATETAVKRADLSRARVLAFATHAGLAGEIAGMTEPALVLTPPEGEPTEEDDGLLTASEAAGLRLDADLVVLSACNTAAADGTPGAAGLSGLAKAFAYAGSRALLVSHWQVYSDAAQGLTTRMIGELARDPGLDRSEALRRSMVALLDGSGPRRLAHPSAWAPFVLVGDDGPLAPR